MLQISKNNVNGRLIWYPFVADQKLYRRSVYRVSGYFCPYASLTSETISCFFVYISTMHWNFNCLTSTSQTEQQNLQSSRSFSNEHHIQTQLNLVIFSKVEELPCCSAAWRNTSSLWSCHTAEWSSWVGNDLCHASCYVTDITSYGSMMVLSCSGKNMYSS